MKKLTNFKKGFTLVELLVYIAGMVGLMTVVAVMIVQIYGLYGRLTIGPRTDVIAANTLDRIVREIRRSESVDVPNSVLNNLSAGALMLNLSDGGTNTTLLINLSGDSIYLKEGAAQSQKFTPDNITISGLRFNQIVTPISEAVHIDLAVSYFLDGATTTKSYSSVAILRGSYQ